MTLVSGSKAIPVNFHHLANASTVATMSGSILTTPTSFQCRTNGNTRGTPRGTWHSIASLSRSWTPNSRSINSFCSRANGTCTRTASYPPTNGATWRVFQMDRKQRRDANPNDAGDLAFLERVFHKLMLNFTWWVNRKDAQGRNIFQGGFLGLDNIGVFDRSAPLPTGGFINQADR